MARRESLAQAKARMRREGWSEKQITGQVNRWHRENAARPPRSPAPLSSGQHLAVPGHALEVGGATPQFGGRDATIWAAKNSPAVVAHLLVPPRKPAPLAPTRRGYRAPAKPAPLHKQYEWAKQAVVKPDKAKKLADTVTPEERQQILAPAAASRAYHLAHPTLGHQLLQSAEHLAGQAVRAPVEKLLGAAWGGAQGQPSLPQVPHAGAIAGGALVGRGMYSGTTYGTLGPDLTNYLSGKPHDKLGLKMDVAMLPLLAVPELKPLRAARVAAQLGKLAAEGEHSLPALRQIAEELYHGPGLLKTRAATSAIKKAKQADEQLVEAAIKSGRLSAPHERALRDYAAAEREVEAAAAKVKGATGEAKKLAEKELDQAKGRRAAAKGSETYERARAFIKPEPLPFNDPRQIAREQVAKDLLKNLKGSKNALPPGATRKQISNLFQFLDHMAHAGVWGRHWYEDSARAIKEMFPGDPVKAERFAQLLAIYSPQQPIIGNTSLAIRASNEWHFAEQALREAEAVKGGTGAITTGQDWQRREATKVMQGRGDWDGRKTNNFYVNFLEDINPAKFRQMVEDGEIRPDGVTIDMWMARVFGYTSDDVTAKGRYDFMESIVRQLAKERGEDWKPKQVQAAIWTAIKGISDDVTANIDFSTGIERHFGQFNFESAPGQAFLDDFSTIYANWPTTVQHIFQTMNARLVDDFVREVGLMAERGVEGAGTYATEQGLEQNPATALRFLTSAAPRGEKGAVAYRVFEPERVQIERVAAAIGRALHQDSVAWIRPFVALSKGHANATHLDLGRVGTAEEAKALWQALNGKGERFAVINAHDGFYVKNIDDSLKNLGTAKSPGSRELAVKAANEVFPDHDVSVTHFASDGDLVPSESYASHLGEGSDAGGPGPDVRFTSAADRLASEADELRRRFIDASEQFADASGQVNPAAVRRELDRLQGMPWERVAVEDDLAATERWMQGIGPPLTDEFGNPVSSARYLTKTEPDELPLTELGRTRGKRTLRVGELEVAMPHARATNPLTAAIPHGIEKTADWFSKQIDKTLLTEHPNVWVIGTSGGEARALKQAGRMKRMEPYRRAAEFGQEIRTIIAHKEGSLTDLSHYWYAQLPADYRNAEGLQLIRGAQQKFLDDIQSGAKMARLEEEKQAARDEMKALEASDEQNSAQWWEAKGRLTMLDEVMADLPSQQRNLTAQTIALDKLIAAAPPVDEEVMSALRSLTRNREEILTEAGRLADEAVDERPGLLARTLGLEPDGSEIYMGHRMGKDPNSGFSRFLPSIGTGRVKSPPGMSKNQLILWSTGRLRPSMRIGLEDWQHAGVFEQTVGMRNEIWQAAEPFYATKNQGYLKGKVIVNIKGRVIPANWRTDELSQFGEGWDEVKDIRMLAEEMVKDWAADSRAAQEEMLAALERGELRHQDLRVIDQKKLERYAKQFRSSKGRSAPGAVGDMLTDMIAASIVTLRIGFVPKNMLQNVITMLPHQGALAIRNLVRFAQVWHEPELRDFFLAEAGGRGATAGIGQEASKMRATGNLMRKVTGKLTEVADDPFRIAAVLHEMAAEGIINRGPGLLTEQDKTKMLRYFRDKSEGHLKLKNQINMRANNALPDFSRLTPDQSRILRRVAIIPGWLMAGSRWPFHFAATHPIRSMLIAYIAMGEPDAPQELRFNEPVTHYFHGRRYLRGIDTPWGRERISSLDPVSTPWELAVAAYGSIKGKKSPFDYDTDTLWSKVAPGPATLVEWLQGEGTFSDRASRDLNRLFPVSGLISNMIDPQPSPSYPGDKTRGGRLRREVGILPIPVNDNPPKKGRRRRGGDIFGGSGGGSVFGGGSSGSVFGGR